VKQDTGRLHGGDGERLASDLLDELETASLLNVSRNTLRNWRCLGRGPQYVRLGDSRMIRYRRADIERYIHPVDHDLQSAAHGHAHTAL